MSSSDITQIRKLNAVGCNKCTGSQNTLGVNGCSYGFGRVGPTGDSGVAGEIGPTGQPGSIVSTNVASSVTPFTILPGASGVVKFNNNLNTVHLTANVLIIISNGSTAAYFKIVSATTDEDDVVNETFTCSVLNLIESDYTVNPGDLVTVAGLRGFNGADGADGATGAIGADGATGATGATGDDGADAQRLTNLTSRGKASQDSPSGAKCWTNFDVPINDSNHIDWVDIPDISNGDPDTGFIIKTTGKYKIDYTMCVLNNAVEGQVCWRSSIYKNGTELANNKSFALTTLKSYGSSSNSFIVDLELNDYIHLVTIVAKNKIDFTDTWAGLIGDSSSMFTIEYLGTA